MAPKAARDGKAAEADAAAEAAVEQQALMEAELVTAVLRSRLGRCVCGVLLLLVCARSVGLAQPVAHVATRQAHPRDLSRSAAHLALLHRCQAVGEKLAVENFSLTDELAKQSLTLQDINEFLTSEVCACGEQPRST
jgi:hypothetical protein